MISLNHINILNHSSKIANPHYHNIKNHVNYKNVHFDIFKIDTVNHVLKNKSGEPFN